MLSFLFNIPGSCFVYSGDSSFMEFLSGCMAPDLLPVTLCFCQVHLLRTAGDEVTITVRYLREVPSFLKLPLGKHPVTQTPKNFNNSSDSSRRDEPLPVWALKPFSKSAYILSRSAAPGWQKRSSAAFTFSSLKNRDAKTIQVGR